LYFGIQDAMGNQRWVALGAVGFAPAVLASAMVAPPVVIQEEHAAPRLLGHDQHLSAPIRRARTPVIAFP
jgi:hypothetical protein